MELPGADPEGPLGRGLAKLARALSEVGLDTNVGSKDDNAGVAIELDRPLATDDLAEAATNGWEMAVTYYSPARDERTERSIVPRHVFVDGGNWYVVADDDRSGEQRTFRIDRIDTMTATGRTVPSADVVSTPAAFFDDADLPVAVLRLAPAAHWLLDRYPIRNQVALSEPAGWIEASLPVASSRWLARLLIRLGPDVEVVSPGDAAAEAAELASAVLARY
jgi:proteasome accessory factor C